MRRVFRRRSDHGHSSAKVQWAQPVCDCCEFANIPNAHKLSPCLAGTGHSMKTSFACSYPSISMLALDLPASRCRFLPIADCQSFNTRSSRRPVFTLARKHKRKHKRTHAHVHARARARAHTHTHTHTPISRAASLRQRSLLRLLLLGRRRSPCRWQRRRPRVPDGLASAWAAQGRRHHRRLLAAADAAPTSLGPAHPPARACGTARSEQLHCAARGRSVTR